MLVSIEKLMGQTYNKFTVIDVFYGTLRNKNGTICRCKCVCGNIRDYFAADAKRKTSCGCMRNLRVSTMRLGKPSPTRKDYGVSSANSFYRGYLYRAKKAGIIFDLTKEEFLRLTKQNCYFCGVEPQAMYKRTKTEHGHHIHNGVDRLNNEKGYLKDNCVPCCKWCNFAKNIRNEGEYLRWVETSYLHLKEKKLLI